MMASSTKRKPASPPAEEWIASAEAALRAAGHRASRPRAEVLDVIASQDCVLTAHEIADELRRRRRRVGIATIYRTIELLEDLRLLQRLDTGGGPARYEPVLPSGDHHHHLICAECDRVTPFEDEQLERAIASLERRLSHSVDEHDVVLRGRCPDCARARR